MRDIQGIGNKEMFEALCFFGSLIGALWEAEQVSPELSMAQGDWHLRIIVDLFGRLGMGWRGVGRFGLGYSELQVSGYLHY